jgi:hypothetical protein
MPWRALRISTCDIVLIDWLRRPNRNNPPPHNMVRLPERPKLGSLAAIATILDDLVNATH